MLYPLLLFLPSALAHECFSCNDGALDDDGKPCIDQKTLCADGIGSCSMLVYRSGGQTRVRKFCTAPNTPIQQYLVKQRGSNICQHLTTGMPAHKRYKNSPPAPPVEGSSALLCVCSTPLCNKGSYIRVLESTMLRGLVENEDLSPPDLTNSLEPEQFHWETVRDHPDADLDKQMADAGF